MRTPRQILLTLLCCALSFGQAHAACTYKTLQVSGIERSEILCTPAASKNPAPVVLVFHGRGGSGRNIAEGIRLHEAWPEALVVYLDGLPGIPAPYDPEGQAAGWQLNAGEANDRDVALTDATLDDLAQHYNIDQRHIFATGYSNGSKFLGVLWALRASRFAAFAFSASQAGFVIEKAEPRSVFMGMGMHDELIPFSSQRRSIALAATRFGLGQVPSDQPGVNRYKNKNGSELMVAIHPGGHMWPADQTSLIVDFFKRQMQK